MEMLKLLHHGIFGITCASYIYKTKSEKEIDIQVLFKEYERLLLNNIIK